MRRIWAYYTLIRVPNCLMASAAVAVGWYLSPVADNMRLNPFTMAAAFFVCGFGNIVNDIHDLKIDRIIHPRRALPSGTISMDRARTLAFVFLIVIMISLWWMNSVERTIVVAAVPLVVIYDLRLKHTAFWGNILVSLLGAATFLLGGAPGGFGAATALPGPLIPAIFAVLMHFGREVVKDIHDRAGDRSAGSKTGPVRMGTVVSMLTADSVFVLLCPFCLAVYLFGWFTMLYLIIVVVAIGLPLPALIFWMGLRPSAAKCRLMSSLIKTQMLIGMAALVLGKSY
jgi:geranylgeranylglycerol-phosphate geranylgeranyltransferase